jgi:hypothetical protein
MSANIQTYEADAIDILASQERSTPIDESAKRKGIKFGKLGGHFELDE